MLSYWLAAPLSFWWPLAFAVGFALIAVIAVGATMARSAEEPQAGTIATLYGVGFGLAAVSEFMMFLDLAFGLSLAAAFTMSAGVVTFFAVAAIVIAAFAVAIAALMQISEEGSYRASHRLAQ
ncbi:MAG TPA: hypothetical protein VF725_07905 [Ktedonobacterales bacterium]|jgi:hypothetical protein